MLALDRELLLRSVDENWTAAEWERLLHDAGNRYEITAGVLYMSTLPSVCHQRILRQIARQLFRQIDAPGLGITL